MALLITPGELPKWVPGTVLCASDELGWKGVGFTRRFRESFGCTAHHFLVERRVDRARQLLLHSKTPVKEIASACGFADQAHLTRVFRERLNATPASLRRSS